jgi:hypothetical protein
VRKSIRRFIAGLTLTAAAATGLALTTDLPIPLPAGDTTWGAPDTTDDSRWDTPTPDTGNDVDPVLTPLDTTWG